MENTPLSPQEQQDAVKVYQIAKAFISSHASREVQEHLGQMFGCYVAATPTVYLHEVSAHDVAQTIMDVVILSSSLRTGFRTCMQRTIGRWGRVRHRLPLRFYSG